MTKEGVNFWVFLVLLVILLVGASFWKRYECSSKWGRSGRDWSWGPVAGCQIQRADGRWFPAETYREVTP